ncbi:MAG: rod shape-determining protein MreC [Saprospiraceae bacterium]|nr:rod shape-determining protein MreC [Saprospiraceae bacterium]
MGRLFQLLLKNGGFVTLIFVELFCFIIIVKYNTSQAVIWANTSEIFGGRLMERRQKVTDYFGLQERADSLARVLDSLQARLANARVMQFPLRDTFFSISFDTIYGVDTIRRKSIRPEYDFVSGKVVENSITNANNWLLINRGRTDQVAPHMAVVSPQGVVGIIRHVSDHFSIAMSVLHSQTRITASLNKVGAFGSLVWQGGDPSVMTLKDISKHFQDRIKPGDLVSTSGYSVMFPKDHPVGTVISAPSPDPGNPHFLVVQVKLSQDMSNVSDISIVRNLYTPEIDSLKSRIKQ